MSSTGNTDSMTSNEDFSPMPSFEKNYLTLTANLPDFGENFVIFSLEDVLAVKFLRVVKHPG